MKRESNVPDEITAEHVGSRVLVRFPGCAGPSEGLVEELSGEAAYVRIGRRWVPNGEGHVLAVLGGPRRRREAVR